MQFIPLTKGRMAIVDDEDYDLVRFQRWCYIDAGAQCRARKGNGVRILMHRLIMNAPKGVVVDHINHDRLDNRRSNLRLATSGENSRNKKPAKSRKYKGVMVDKRGYIRSVIQHEGKTYCLGSFTTPEQAARAYDVKARELHGAFAYLNFPTEDEIKQQLQVQRPKKTPARSDVAPWSDRLKVNVRQIRDRVNAFIETQK